MLWVACHVLDTNQWGVKNRLHKRTLQSDLGYAMTNNFDIDTNAFNPDPLVGENISSGASFRNNVEVDRDNSEVLQTLYRGESKLLVQKDSLERAIEKATQAVNKLEDEQGFASRRAQKLNTDAEALNISASRALEVYDFGTGTARSIALSKRKQALKLKQRSPKLLNKLRLLGSKESQKRQELAQLLRKLADINTGLSLVEASERDICSQLQM